VFTVLRPLLTRS